MIIKENILPQHIKDHICIREYDLYLDECDFEKEIPFNKLIGYRFRNIYIPENIDFKNSDWYTAPCCSMEGVFFPDIYIIKKLEL